MAELIREGLAMKHCVAEFGQEILHGRYYAYRVLAPARATLGIKLKGGCWFIDQSRGAANAGISCELRSFLQKWIKVDAPF